MRFENDKIVHCFGCQNKNSRKKGEPFWKEDEDDNSQLWKILPIIFYHSSFFNMKTFLLLLGYVMFKKSGLWLWEVAWFFLNPQMLSESFSNLVGGFTSLIEFNNQYLKLSVGHWSQPWYANLVHIQFSKSEWYSKIQLVLQFPKHGHVFLLYIHHD